MALSYQTSFGLLTIPQAAVNISIVSQPNGLAANGILFLIGEADQGPSWGQETSPLDQIVAWGPGQGTQVAAKYGSGSLVDAFNAIPGASNDPQINGSPAKIFTVKVNTGTQASLILKNNASGTYVPLLAKRAGLPGSSIAATITNKTTEILPTTGSFTWIPNVAGINTAARVNGGAQHALSIGVHTNPDTLQALAWDASMTVVGGANRAFLTAGQNGATVTIAVGSADAAGHYPVTFTISTAWAVIPTIGDTLVVPHAGALGTANDTLSGGYVITASGSAAITATKLSDNDKSGASAGVITTPTTGGSPITIVAGASDMKAFAPLQISNSSATIIDGVGKSLELADLGTGADVWSRYVYQLSTTPVSWISVSGTPVNLVSAAETSVNLNLQRASDSLNEDVLAGGAVVLRLGYKGTTATVTISPTLLTTSVTGGSGANLSIPLTNFSTVKDLATYINTQTGYAASVATAVIGLQPPQALDEVVAVGICSDEGAANGRIKMDATAFQQAVLQQSTAAVIGTPTPTIGLPAVMSQTFLAGGARGGSSTAQFLAAIDAIKGYIGNFVVPLISQNAVVANGFGSTDILLGKTDSSSTYVAQTVMAYANTHCLAMSKAKVRKNRQAFASVRDTFINSQNASANIAGFRTSMTFQDVTVLGVQQQPWMGAVMAASMQAAGFYRSILKKLVNIQGVVSAAGDFNSQDADQMTAALQAGLLPVSKSRNGGYFWVSDQTTYGKDGTPIPNSMSAVYNSDLIAVDLAETMEDAFAGQAAADISASGAQTFLESRFSEYLRLKLTAPSDDAPKGFKNASILLSLPALAVSVEAKVDTAVYFIPIQLYVSTVTQSAKQ